jgi:hypothetical protein
MIHYPIVIFREQTVPQAVVDQLAQIFELHPGPIKLRIERKPVEIPKNGSEPETLAWKDVFTAMSDLATKHSVPDEHSLCLLTATPNEDNWFAVNDPDHPGRFFIHVDDYSWVTCAPPQHVTAHYVMKCLFNTLLMHNQINLEDLRHYQPEGCFNDFCRRKSDLNFKLRTADICGDCLEVYRSAGLSDSLFSQVCNIMEETRRLATNTSQFLPQEEIFKTWPYPVAITRHKVVQSRRPLFRFLLLLDHFDSMVRYFFLAREVSEGRQPTLEDRPSLGWWVDQLAQSLKGAKQFREVVKIAQQDRVVMLRNERRGHGYMATTEDAYSEEAAALEQTLTRIEDELRPFFERYQLVIPREIRIAGGDFHISGDLLAGSHSLHPPFELKIPDNPCDRGLVDQHRVYLTDREFTRFHAMNPFLLHENCPECKHPRLLITDGGNQYIDAFMGHRVDIKH